MTTTKTPTILAKHTAAALAATAVDFVVMIGLVELFSLPPGAATLLGALSGGVTNYSLGRLWVYRSTNPKAGEALRYAAVSMSSAMWNALFEHVAVSFSSQHYAVLRFGVSLAVSVLWNYPMQRYVVFAPRGEGGAPALRATSDEAG